jgi:D-glycero-D-manno-heptose 1,7-bisphosphate phosphatase
MMGSGRAAAFLDRDGTITVERGHVVSPDELELVEGAAAAIRALNEAGMLAVVVSNQSGVARGLMTEDDLARIHERLEVLLAAEGARLDGAYYCPNFADGTVERYTHDTSCRKPEIGMLTRAARDLGIDLEASAVVGDQVTDVELAHRAGIPGVLVMTGKGARADERASERGIPIAYRAADLGDAVRWLLTGRGES